MKRGEEKETAKPSEEKARTKSAQIRTVSPDEEHARLPLQLAPDLRQPQSLERHPVDVLCRDVLDERHRLLLW